MKKLFVILPTLIAPHVYGATCPTGYTESLASPKPGYGLDANGRCSPLCPLDDIKTLNTSTGHVSHIFDAPHSAPTLAVGYNDTICYVDLVKNTSGGNNAGINVQYNDTVYHTRAAASCYESYELSYDCGTNANGLPPQSVDVHWGDLFPAPLAGAGNSCQRPGYSLTGWEIDGTTAKSGGGAPYTWAADNTATAVWTPNEYTGYYDCGVCQYGYTYQPTNAISQFLTTKFGDTVRVTALTSCVNTDGLELAGYGIYNVNGELGKLVQPGEDFTWDFTYNPIISPIYNTDVSRVSTATFSCGEGATGNPAVASRRVRFGELINMNEVFGNCKRPGYSMKGILADGKTGMAGNGFGAYPAGDDAVATPNWTANEYTGYYDCGICQYGYTYQPTDPISQFLTTKFGDTVRVTALTSCINTDGLELAGYGIYNMNGELGKLVQPGEDFTWEFPYNALIAPVYSNTDISRVSTATFSCGDGATGKPGVTSRRVRFGELINMDEVFGNCHRPGYYMNGILADGKTTPGGNGFGAYPAGDDAVATPNWTANEYAVYYDCTAVKSGANSTMQTVHWGDAVVASDTCGENVMYTIDIGGETGTTQVAAGDTFIFQYVKNITLTAI